MQDGQEARPHCDAGHAGTPLVSIVVLAYNHLEYTRQCVESILRHTSHINYELITVDNGSTDGTAEYFMSLPHSKKISLPSNIGVCKAINRGFALARGKYAMNVSNDIVATERWLDNLLICMESDDRIGMAVPICNASCNYQQLTLPFTGMDEIQEFARQHNVSDPRKWEERLKLCTYAGIYRTELLRALGGFDEDFNPGCYDDDAMCFSIRRMGCKVILAKDAFVHHYGACSFNEEYEKDKTLMTRNFMLFMSKFKANPYIAGLIDFDLLDLLSVGSAGSVNILGMGKSYGSTVLQLKNLCRYRSEGNIALYYLSECPGNMEDLKTICDDCHCGSQEDIRGRFGSRLYDYIVVESESGSIADRLQTYSALYGLLMPGGQLICTAASQEILYETMGIFFGLGAKLAGQLRYYYLNFVKPPELQ